jgi:GDP-L-fucose synthase
MTILVTGSDGLVGMALRDSLRDDAFFASRRDADLRNFDATLKLFKRVKPDRVIHLAALVGGIGGNTMKSGEYLRDNVLINMNVLECARLTQVERLVSLMSTCIFPNDGPYPLEPKNLHLGEPHPSNFGYAYAKRLLEVQSRAYRAQWEKDFLIAIPTNIFGPHDNFNLEEGHVVPALIHKIHLAKENQTSLSVWGSGSPKREFIYSRDVAQLLAWMLESYSGVEPLILSSGKETSIKDLVTDIVTITRYPGDVVFDLSKPDGQFRKPSKVDALQSLLPDYSFTSLHQGLVETIDWFQKNYPRVRL